jgi:pyruvate decarboxylase
VADRQYASYPTTDIRHILPLLVPAFAEATSKTPKNAHGDSFGEKIRTKRVEVPLSEPQGNEIKHDWFWGRMGKWFRDEGEYDLASPPGGQADKSPDVIITETGTSSFGLLNVPLPSVSTYVTQVLWGSIGWSVGATLGCALAAREQKQERRTVLYVGDGSLQLVRFNIPAI